MTGIERLRKLSYTVCKTIGDMELYKGSGSLWSILADIAGQIEREHVSRMRVLAVITEMELHVSGVEGAEDSPVARWERELREALGGEVRENGAVVEPVDGRPCGRCRADYLTHERPVADTWERLEEDVANASCPDVYCTNHHIDASDASYEWAMARDIVRRARALTERDA